MLPPSWRQQSHYARSESTSTRVIFARRHRTGNPTCLCGEVTKCWHGLKHTGQQFKGVEARARACLRGASGAFPGLLSPHRRSSSRPPGSATEGIDMIDRIAQPWGTRTPYGPGEDWPVRVDMHLAEGVSEDDVETWVPTASILHSNGDAMDIAVKDGRIVGVRGHGHDRVNHGRLGPKDLRS